MNEPRRGDRPGPLFEAQRLGQVSVAPPGLIQCMATLSLGLTPQAHHVSPLTRGLWPR
jgi:hypothetical protein